MHIFILYKYKYNKVNLCKLTFIAAEPYMTENAHISDLSCPVDHKLVLTSLTLMRNVENSAQSPVIIISEEVVPLIATLCPTSSSRCRLPRYLTQAGSMSTSTRHNYTLTFGCSPGRTEGRWPKDPKNIYSIQIPLTFR